MFRRIWPRRKPRRGTTGNAELDRWFKELRESIDAQTHPTASSIDKALLALEGLSLAAQIEQEERSSAQQAATAPPATVAERQPSLDQEVILPVPRMSTPDGSEGRSTSAATPGRQRTYKIVLSGVAIGTVFALAGTAAVMGPQGLSGNNGFSSPMLLVGTTSLRVGVLPVVDVAPFYRALDAGYFADQGLDVETVTTPSGPDAIADLVAGRLDVAFASYPGILKAQSDKRADLKIIAPAYTARPGHLMLVAPPDGRIRGAEDVAGKRIAVTSRNSISDLGAMAELQSRGVDLSTIQWVSMAMPDMSIAMQQGDVDGAVLAEPYITMTDNSFKARPIVDVAIGKTARIPMSGWGALSELSRSKPHAVEAFVRALSQGRNDVSDRAVLDLVMEKHLGIDWRTAKEVNIADFSRSVDAKEIQRVADLMRSFNVIQERLDVSSMLL